MSIDLTTAGTPTFAAGKFGNAATFPTQNDYFTLAGGGTQLRSTTGFTIEFWGKTTDTGYVMAFAVGSEWWGFAGGKPSSNTQGGGGVGSASYNDGNWHHFAWCYTGTQLLTYADGTQISAVNSTASSSGYSAAIFLGAYSATQYSWKGSLDDVRFSKVARYTGATYTVPTAQHTADADTLGLWRLEANGADSSAAVVTAPGAPTALTAVPASGQVALSWTAPASNGGAAITDYVVEYQPSGGSWTTFADGVSTATGATVTGLTNGTAYNFRVSAVNSVGTGTPSATVTSTPAVPPADTTAPTISSFTATAGNAQVALAWAGTDNVGITRWLLKRGTTTVYDGAGTSYTDTGLTNGTQYSYSLVAYDAAGNASTTATATATPAAAPTGIIAANDTGIVYSPYTWDITSTRAMTVCSGAYLRTEVIGSATSITATFDVSGFSGTCELVITVDDAAPVVVNLAASVTVPIPTSNSWPKHIVEIFVRRLAGAAKWTSPTTAVKFTGFTLAPTSCTVVAPRPRPWRLMCFGDSLAEGYSTRINGVNDTRFGWAHPLRDLLGAQVGIAGYSAAGITKGGEGAVPALPTSYNKLYDGVARSFTAGGEPHVVVINYGTNDNGADISAGALAVLNGILAATTTTKIAVVQQWNGILYRTAWQNAIASSAAPSRCTYIDTTGWLNAAVDSPDNLHPYGYTNLADLSPRLAAAIAPLLTGTSGTTPVTYKRFINQGGVAVGIG